MSKGAVVSATLAMARDLGRYRIRCVCLAPSMFETPMTAPIPQEARDRMVAAAAYPHRLGHPREFARAVLAILDNPMFNGAVLRIDGATRMQAQL